MVEELKFKFDALLSSYPSGIEVNSLIAGKYFGLKKEHVCPGNGAAELIRSLMRAVRGDAGIVYPTFEEYPNRAGKSKIVPYYPKGRDFAYTGRDLADYFGRFGVEAVILVNPGNPTGFLLKRGEVLELAAWARRRGIKLIVDESFIDFCDAPEEQTLLTEEILRQYPNLVVIKSISKSFGVPGLRLGIAASADEDLISFLKSDVAIWNINSFAECFLQIFEKYKKDYAKALEQFRLTRKEFVGKLRHVPNLRVLPTQANFVLCEVLGGCRAERLAETLLCGHNILIKDLSGKKGLSGEYIRLAIRTREENSRLAAALGRVLGQTGRFRQVSLGMSG
jgi:histidinol-phosphate/aromatic aminotransferase/cobyric acid decarboxylase-like protein